MGGLNCKCLNDNDDYSVSFDYFPGKKKEKQLKTAKFVGINMKEIRTVQAALRGALSRRLVSQISKITKKAPKGATSSSISIVQHDSMVPTLPSLVQDIKNRLGPFKKEPNSENVSLRSPTRLDNGTVYVGEWSTTGKKHGHGTLYFDDGGVFEGYWVDDQVNGKGRHIHHNGEYYEGDWKNDMLHGYGRIVHEDGSTYDGTWKCDKQHGFGIEVWADGAVYKGEFLDGVKTGKGEFRWKDKSSYKGEFKFNKLEGIGTYTWNDGRVYKGQWQANKMHGTGAFTWPDGRTYTGEYQEDKKHGQGKFVWPDGKVYDGEWKNGKQDGIGYFSSTENKLAQKKGEWSEGRRIRWITEENNLQNMRQHLKNMETHLTIFIGLVCSYIPTYFIAKYFDNIKPETRINPKTASSPSLFVNIDTNHETNFNGSSIFNRHIPMTFSSTNIVALENKEEKSEWVLDSAHRSPTGNPRYINALSLSQNIETIAKPDDLIYPKQDESSCEICISE